MAAGRRWAQGAPRRDADDDDAVAALVAVGVSAEEARAAAGGQYDEAETASTATDHDFPVLACNLLAVRVFCALATQWRHHPMGGLLGLDYGCIPDVLRLMAVPRKRWPQTFEQLRVLEAGAQAAIRELRQRPRPRPARRR